MMKTKILYTFFLFAFILASCHGKDYKYKIIGKMPRIVERQVGWNEINVTEELVDVIAYTDTIHGANKDSIWYYNSDGSKLTIHSPYGVQKLIK